MTDRVLEAIRNRADLETEKISVRKLLRQGGVEGWTDMCCDRICDSVLLDGEDAVIGFVDFPDIELTSGGVLSCKEILLSYVSENLISDTFSLLCGYEELTRETNNYAAILRKMKLVDLWKTYRELGNRKYGDEDMRIRKYILAEVWNRSVFARVKRWLWAVLIRICTRVKYHRLISSCDKVCAKEC